MSLQDSFGSPLGTDVTIGSLVQSLLSNAIVLAGIIMVFLFIGGGLTMVISAGKNDPQGAAKGRSAVTWALVGFIIIFTAYWIIRIIEIISDNRFFTNPQLGF